jgi:flagella basal body P-ring formation protein FlgA
MSKLDPKFAGLVAAAVLANGAAFADEPTAARNIRVGTVLSASDIVAPQSEGGLREAASYIGLEAARPIYKGEPVSRDDLRAPTVVARNAVVTMEFEKGALLISTEGRALEPGAVGDRVRVMNLGSKRIVSAFVTAANTVRMKQ